MLRMNGRSIQAKMAGEKVTEPMMKCGKEKRSG